MDWDTWLTTAQWHDYNGKYHPGNWRGWFDFGMGAIGDWAAHIIDTCHQFLELGLPYEVEPLKLTGANDFFFPQETTLRFKFGPRGDMPPVEMMWYDGQKNFPPLPAGYGSTGGRGADVPATNMDGTFTPSALSPGKIIYSKELTFKGGSHGATLEIIPKEKAAEMASRLPEVPASPSNHLRTSSWPARAWRRRGPRSSSSARCARPSPSASSPPHRPQRSPSTRRARPS
jgi:hypothetical protein